MGLTDNWLDAVSKPTYNLHVLICNRDPGGYGGTHILLKLRLQSNSGGSLVPRTFLHRRWNTPIAKQLMFTVLATVVLTGILGLSGCGGGAENSVAAPPEHPPTEEELAAQSRAYAAQEQEMRARDRRK